MSSGPIEEAKLRLRIHELWRLLGLPGAPGKSCHVPWRKDVKRSGSVYDDGLRWTDFGNNEGGDAIDFLAKARGLSPSDAVKEFLRLAGVTNTNGAPVLHGPSEPPLDWPKCVGALTPALRVKLAQWRGISVAAVEWLQQRQVIGLVDGLVAFAVINEQGKVLGCHVRHKDGTWRYKPNGIKLHPLIFSATRRAARALVYESQWDLLATLDLLGWWQTSDGLPDTCAIATRGSANGRIIKGLVSPEATVFAFVQNDEPKEDGKIPAEEWLKSIAEHAGCRVLRVVTPAQFGDLNDWVKAGATRADLEAAMNAAQPVEPPTMPSATETLLNDSRVKVRLPGDNHLLSETAEAVGKILSPTNLFERGGLVFKVDRAGMRLVLVTPESFRTLLEYHAVPFKLSKRGGTEIVSIKRTVSADDSKGILASPQFLEHLRSIQRLNSVRLPVMRQNGKIEMLPAGYDEQSRTFTFDTASVETGMPFDEAKHVIDSLLFEFVFNDKGRSKAVAVSACLTLFGLGLLPPHSLRPAFIFLGNAPGAGKGLLVKVAVVPVLGIAPVGTRPSHEEEMQKSLLAAVAEARQAILFDNVKGRLDSETLEGFITAQHYEGRLLGASKRFCGENHATVFITGNGCTVSGDMRRRSLFVELFLEAEKAEDRTFRQPLEVPLLLQRRSEILAALWSMVAQWDRSGRPKPSRSSSSFPQWAEVIGGITQYAGFGCPLETPEIDGSADVDSDDMHVLINRIAGSQTKSVSFDELVRVSRDGGLFDRVLPPDGDLDARARSTLGKLFKSYHRRLVGGYRFIIQGRGNSRRFEVERTEGPATTPEPIQQVQSPETKAEPETMLI